MSKRNYILVLGASGNIGGKIVQELLDKGAVVGAIGRNSARLQNFAKQADILEGDFGDDNFLKGALEKANSVFLTVPDEHLINPAATAKRLANLLKGTAVTHIVNISNSITSKGGNATRLVAFEQELNQHLDVNLKHLRCANFFENLNWGICTPYRPDLKLPYISSYEVAHVAAAYLQNQNFISKTVDVLLGPQDYSMAELASLAGVTYQQLPYTEQNRSFYEPFNEGDFEVEPRTAENTSMMADAKFSLQYFLNNDLKIN